MGRFEGYPQGPTGQGVLEGPGAAGPRGVATFRLHVLLKPVPQGPPQGRALWRALGRRVAREFLQLSDFMA
eukprot:NODE_13300_length_363_cov_41.837580_g12146_i0.p2 GENE.NODE_13300_length_363_cov_41.837580_g12146_i0~~NODE_13300_length_363_cov_41.837580_g12146_i0.p2  ORF type:complete len:71 (-),score=2.19 NODE_13300_length_363_cov_41.837580_g12146_i0:66-278(-)